MKQITDLHGMTQDRTVYVLGSGKTLDYIDTDFFKYENVFATNFAGQIKGVLSYTAFTHYHEDALELLKEDGADYVVTPRIHQHTGREWEHGDYPHLVLVDMIENFPPGAGFNPFIYSGTGNHLLFGSSSLHGTMHLAAYAGASTIILVGADCGTLDGEHRIDGYPDGDKHWGLYNGHLELMKAWLKQEYDCNIYSLNPFVNLNLEGHRFDGV